MNHLMAGMGNIYFSQLLAKVVMETLEQFRIVPRLLVVLHKTDGKDLLLKTILTCLFEVKWCLTKAFLPLTSVHDNRRYSSHYQITQLQVYNIDLSA